MSLILLNKVGYPTLVACLLWWLAPLTNHSCSLFARMPSQNRLGTSFQGNSFGYVVHLC